MSRVEVHMFPCLNDNYGFLVHSPDSGVTAAVDTPEVEPILGALADTGWTLTYIWNTHHHGDHAGGNLPVKAATGCRIIGPRADAARIPGIDIEVGEGDRFDFGGHEVEVFDTPGHTRGHIVYLLRKERLAFVGDTLFSMGCGRLFEGSPAQMWASLGKILAWPDDTRLYCAHEYTQANARFALSVEPANAALVERAAEVERLREQGVPTVPTSLALEKATNPFLRPASRNLRATIGLPNADDVAVFARTRALKDAF
ncbi:MAG TPA: hydroxyacylglutathione hydrolase [Gammaproteobacteria bacterium]|nr:hydroxyacylglutathione hydrolase [Gammaproteobacteria bacterium]